MARRITEHDFKEIAAYICDCHSQRRSGRKDLERQWKEIDRQLRMEPDRGHKVDSSGQVIPSKQWMPEMELPLQAQTLEVLVADARRMMSAPLWFSSHAAVTDEYLERNDLQSLITGDENDVPSRLTQDNVDKLVNGVLNTYHRQYDFWGNVDLINTEAFKYSMGIGRVRPVTKTVFIETAKGVIGQKQKIPVLFPISIKNTYLDTNEAFLMNEGHILGPAQIFEKTQLLKDIEQASMGSSDPDREDGGWIPKNLKGVEPDKHGNVKLLEFEGDLIVPRKTTDNIFLPGVIVTVLIDSGKDGQQRTRVIRYRNRKHPFSSYIQFPYHRESLDSPYGTSPLLKGWPIQKAASDALNRIIEAGLLNTQPPLSWDKDDPYYASTGGPQVFPGASWGTTGEVKPHDIGDPVALFGVYTGLLQQYADVTGVNAPRLGAQTVSHTTAFAKEAELSRGTIRTVDYVNSTLDGPMKQYLNAAYYFGKEYLKKTDIYIDEYGGFVTVDKSNLPELCVFDVFGSGGPAEDRAKKQDRLAALQFALQMDQLRMQAAQAEATLGVPSSLDFEGAMEQVLREGGWTDVDTILKRGNSVPQGTQIQPGMGVDPTQVGTAPGAALQALALGAGNF